MIHVSTGNRVRLNGFLAVATHRLVGFREILLPESVSWRIIKSEVVLPQHDGSSTREVAASLAQWSKWGVPRLKGGG